MAEKEFKLDTTFTDSSRNFLRPIAVLLAVVGIAAIVLSVTTGLATRLLPMDESYLSVLVPRAPDGAEPVSLQTLDQAVANNTLSVHGTVANRTEFAISGLQAVIEVADRFGLPSKTAMVPLDPPELPAKGTATFQATVPVPDQLSGYSIRFQLADGPFVPHKDERTSAPEIIAR